MAKGVAATRKAAKAKVIEKGKAVKKAAKMLNEKVQKNCNELRRKFRPEERAKELKLLRAVERHSQELVTLYKSLSRKEKAEFHSEFHDPCA